MMRRLAGLRRMTLHDWALLLEAGPLLARIRVALWLQPFERVQRRYGRRASAPVEGYDADRHLGQAHAVGRAVQRASRLVPSATCLPRALATRAMLERRGVVNDLCFGVARSASGALEAHAWIEVAGVVVVGQLPDLARFQRMPQLPDAIR